MSRCHGVARGVRRILPRVTWFACPPKRAHSGSWHHETVNRPADPGLGDHLDLHGVAHCRHHFFCVLTPAQYRGVVWQPSAEAHIRLLFERDIFNDTLTFNADYLRILGRSVLQAGIATVLCLIIGLPTSWFIATRPAGQKSLWLILVTVPCWVEPAGADHRAVTDPARRGADQWRFAFCRADRWTFATGR